MNAEITNAAFEAVQRYRICDLMVDVGRQEVLRNSARLPLPKLSFDLFLVLIRAAPNLLSIDELMARVWPGVVVNPETVTQRVKLLRDALGDDPDQPRYIAGLRGRGYRLVAAVNAELLLGPEPLSEDPHSSANLSNHALQPSSSENHGAPPAAPWRRRKWRLVGFGAVGLLLLGAGVLMRSEPAAKRMQVLTDSPAVAALPPHSVAVLPFDSLSAQRADDVLALGIPETLLDRLAAVRDLLVIAGESSFALSTKTLDARDIGRKLNARYLIRGTVQHDGQQLRVTVQLIDAESGRQIKSLRFDREVKDIFALQDQIADQVAAALEASLGGFETQQGNARARSVDPRFKALLERERAYSAQQR